MEYYMRSGVLTDLQSGKKLAVIKGSITGAGKRILDAGGSLLCRTSIVYPEKDIQAGGDVRHRRYCVQDAEGNMTASGCPQYADGFDPAASGWPVGRIPRADRVEFTTENGRYTITMHDSRNYTAADHRDVQVVRIRHNSFAGGWQIEADPSITPGMLSCMYVFCRYLEQENDFMFV